MSYSAMMVGKEGLYRKMRKDFNTQYELFNFLYGDDRDMNTIYYLDELGERRGDRVYRVRYIPHYNHKEDIILPGVLVFKYKDSL